MDNKNDSAIKMDGSEVHRAVGNARSAVVTCASVSYSLKPQQDRPIKSSINGPWKFMLGIVPLYIIKKE